MSGLRAGTSMKRSRRRSYRKKKPVIRALTAAFLAIVLIALGAYYIRHHQLTMRYAKYPLRYEEQIVANAERFDLEPWHVAAVVRCESSFNPKATSEVGAMGLMQIMPDTGLWLAGKFDEEESFSEEQLYQPEVNLKYGCWFLGWLMDRYEGDRTLATAAFHAGHRTVDEWLEDPAVSPDGKTLVNIPYSTTRTYVQRVTDACEAYQELYDFAVSDEDAA